MARGIGLKKTTSFLVVLSSFPCVCVYPSEGSLVFRLFGFGVQPCPPRIAFFDGHDGVSVEMMVLIISFRLQFIAPVDELQDKFAEHGVSFMMPVGRFCLYLFFC